MDIRSCATAVHFRPRGFALPLLVALLLVCKSNRTFFADLFVCCSFKSALVVSLRVSFTPLESLRPSCLLDVREIVWRALCHQFLRLQRPSFRLRLFAVPTSMQASGTPASASISPEFLASVIQAIQTPISAIVQQSLAAVVSAPSVSQGFPGIAAQGSSLATRAAHLDACGFHLHRFLLGFCCRFLHRVLLQYHSVNERIIRYVVISCRPIFRPCIFFGFLVFHSTLFFGGLQPTDYNSFCFGFSTNCKPYGDSLADSLTSSTAVRCRPRPLQCLLRLFLKSWRESSRIWKIY